MNETWKRQVSLQMREILLGRGRTITGSRGPPFPQHHASKSHLVWESAFPQHRDWCPWTSSWFLLISLQLQMDSVFPGVNPCSEAFLGCSKVPVLLPGVPTLAACGFKDRRDYQNTVFFFIPAFLCRRRGQGCLCIPLVVFPGALLVTNLCWGKIQSTLKWQPFLVWYLAEGPRGPGGLFWLDIKFRWFMFTKVKFPVGLSGVYCKQNVYF